MQSSEDSPPVGFRPDELLAIVNDHDEEIGGERRDVVHARGLLHRAVHVLVFGDDGRLLIQQRSPYKDTFPLHWECVGGHLGPGEVYREAAEREVIEELGITPHSVTYLAKAAACAETGMEFIEIYRCLSGGALLRPDPAEVSATDWVSLEQLAAESADGTRLFSPTFLHTLREIGLLT